MNRSKLALLAIPFLALASCKKEEEQAPSNNNLQSAPAPISLRFQFVHGANPFDINATYADGAGHAVRFSTLKFYASDFELKDDDGNTVAAYPAKAVLADGSMPTAAYEIGTMGAGHVHQVYFSLGLDSATNHANPTLAPYPLNIPGMHWSWNPAAGYKFLNMEGHVDGNGDGDFDDAEDQSFTYHCATDALLRTDHAHSHADVGTTPVVLSVKMDVAVLMMGLDLLTTNVAMGGGPANVQAMNNLTAAISDL
jgi:hypothetical protein